ncbi:MAG: hypothetical protein AB7L91_18455 [Dehalococcoidia bacterium]
MGAQWKLLDAKKVHAEAFGLGVTPAAAQTNIADPTGGATTDAEARAAIADILDVLEAFGLMAAAE